MRALFVSLIAVVCGIATGAMASQATPTAAGTAYPTTQRIVIRPVTVSGHASPGFSVRRQRKNPIDCSYPEPSPAAVSRNIEFCSPSYEYAIACWKAAGHGHALCLRDPRTRKLSRIPTSGKFAATRRPPRGQRAPLLIVLTDGTRCSIRDGGAWGMRKSQPNWVGTYSCSRHGVVWAPRKARHWGVDESAASWTVRTGGAHGRLVTRHIERSYFVGTA